MARVLAFVPDLLFGSSVLGALRAAGHDVQLVSDIGAAHLSDFDLLVLDLTADPRARIDQARHALDSAANQAAPKTLAFYSHVEVDVREKATEAGFDLVVPRSRMAREGAALAKQLLDGG